MKSISFVLFIWIMAIFLSCKKDDDSEQLRYYSIVNEWKLISVKNNNNNDLLYIPDDIHDMFVEFTDTSIVWITSSCNTGKTYYSASSYGDLNILDITTTKMYCVPIQVMNWEDAYLENLEKAETYLIKDDKLTIYTSGKFNLNFRLEKDSI